MFTVRLSEMAMTKALTAAAAIVWVLLMPARGQGLTKFNGHTHEIYANNFQIPITEVGESPGALLCRTDKTDCCRNNQLGEWFFPNGTQVGKNLAGGDFYRNRDVGIVRLNRRNNATGPIGQYCCAVPTQDDPNARICVMLVPSSGLYFTLGNTLYLPGDIVPITNIGEHISTTFPGSSLVCVTSNVNSQCCMDASGNWFFPNETVVPQIESTSLTVSHSAHQVRLNRKNNALTPTGTFECRVHNEVTGELVAARITLITEPGPVSNLQVTTATSTTLALTWTATGFIDSFEVVFSYAINACSAPQGASGSDLVNNGSVRSHTLRGLNEDSSYTITVRAINNAGMTRITSAVYSTLVSRPSGGPGPLSFSDVNLTSITVQWTELPCSDRNGEITGYTVEYSSTTPPHTDTAVIVSRANNTRLVVGGLLPRTSYTFSVRAQGPAGTSDSVTAARTTATPTEHEEGFFHNGRVLSNGSAVYLSDIGESSNALYCLTDSGQPSGVWNYPNGSDLPFNTSTSRHGIYQTRGLSFLLLNRRSNAVGPTGVYTCLMPDGNGANRSIHIDIVAPPVVILTGSNEQIVGENYTLTCQVTGGRTTPPTYRWFRDGAVLTGQTSDTLSFSPLREIDSGDYACEGISFTSASLRIAAVPLLEIMITATGQREEGQNYTLTCAVSGDESLASTNMRYRWDKGSSFALSRSATLELDPLLYSHTGEYWCTVTIESPYLLNENVVISTTTTVDVNLPPLSAVITATGQPVEGQSYSLTCAVSGDESLASTNRQFRWDKGSTMGIHREATLVFDPLLYSDRGEYTCTTSFESPYLNQIVSVNGTNTVRFNRTALDIINLQVTTPTATTLPITWTVSGFPDRFEVTYSYTVNRCSAPQGAPRTDIISDGSVRSHTLRDLDEDSNYTITVGAINTEGSTEATVTAYTSYSINPGPLSFSDVTSTSITVQWTELPCSDRNGEITGYTVEYSSTTPPHTNTVTVSGSSNTRLVVGGLLPRTNYTFAVRAQGLSGTSDSATTSKFTATPTEIKFFLKERNLPNNSIVLLSDIGEGSGALYCLTDRTQCCSAAAGRERGFWILPDGSNSDNSMADIYFVKGFSKLYLNRRSSAVGPTGVYTCLIPDAGNILRTLYIGLYHSDGEGSLTVSLSNDRISHTLTCVSSGGPVNTVTWRRNGAVISSSPYQQEQSLVNATTSTYYHLLTVTSGDVEDYVGSFTCTVSNRRGNSTTQSITIRDISINRTERVQFFSSTNITCSSDLAVQTIRWLNDSDNGQQLYNNSGQQDLLLPINSIISNTTYSCEVQVMLASGVRVIQQTVTVQVFTLPPSIPPKDVRVMRFSPTFIVVSWIPLNYSEARGSISHYTVAYSPLTSGRKRQALDTMTQTVPGMNTSATRIENLDISADYIVQVSATNGVGTSEWSAETTLMADRGTVTSDGSDKNVIAIILLALASLVCLTIAIVVSVKLWLQMRKRVDTSLDQQDTQIVDTKSTVQQDTQALNQPDTDTIDDEHLYQSLNITKRRDSEDVYTEVILMSSVGEMDQGKQIEPEYININFK